MQILKSIRLISVFRSLLVLYLIFVGYNLKAQVSFYETRFGSDFGDFAVSVKQLNSSHVYIGGYAFNGDSGAVDIALSKLTASGVHLWTKYYGTVQDDYALYMNVTSDKGFIFCGTTQDGNETDVYLLKVDSNGLFSWNTTQVMPGNQSAKFISETPDHGFIMTGFLSDAFQSNDVYIIKTDSVGNLKWTQSYGDSFNSYADMIRPLSNGDYILTADTKSRGGVDYDIQVLRLDSTGGQLWETISGDSLNNGCQGILACADGTFLNYGETEISVASPFDFYVEKFDALGASLWKKNLGGAGTDAAFSAIELNDGYILTGYSNSYNGGGPLDLVVFKIDSSGNMLWQQTYGNSAIDIGIDIIRSYDGNGIFICGRTTGTGNDEDYYLLHLNMNGTLSIGENHKTTGNFIYPNPFSDIVHFKGDISNSTLKVVNALGQVVYVGSATNELNLNLRSGIYLFELTQGPVVKRQIVIKD